MGRFFWSVMTVENEFISINIVILQIKNKLFCKLLDNIIQNINLYVKLRTLNRWQRAPIKAEYLPEMVNHRTELTQGKVSAHACVLTEENFSL